MITNKSKGFTIVELLVVIAIIAVLASIVLVNVTQYINRGRDAAIRGNMSTILVNSAVFYDSTGAGTYTNFNNNTGYTGPAAAITAANTVTGNPTIFIAGTPGDAYCVRATLRDATIFCIDSTGFKGVPTANTDCAVNDLTCQ